MFVPKTEARRFRLTPLMDSTPAYELRKRITSSHHHNIVNIVLGGLMVGGSQERTSVVWGLTHCSRAW